MHKLSIYTLFVGHARGRKIKAYFTSSSSFPVRVYVSLSMFVSDAFFCRDEIVLEFLYVLSCASSTIKNENRIWLNFNAVLKCVSSPAASTHKIYSWGEKNTSFDSSSGVSFALLQPKKKTVTSIERWMAAKKAPSKGTRKVFISIFKWQEMNPFRCGSKQILDDQFI